jgi:hypothetical protein
MEGRRDLRPDAWDAGPPWERVTVGTHGRRGPADARVLGVPAVEFVWVEVGEPPA